VELKEDITGRDVYFPPAREQGEEDNRNTQCFSSPKWNEVH